MTTALQNPQMGEISEWRRVLVFGACIPLAGGIFLFISQMVKLRPRDIQSLGQTQGEKQPGPGTCPVHNRSRRHLLIPLPLPDTYAQGGPGAGTLASMSKMGNGPP